MRGQLVRYFRQRRREQGLGMSDLARKIGYANVTKGCNKIRQFEERGEIHADLLRKLADALGIEMGVVNRLIEEDRRECDRQWNEWADQPIAPHLLVPVNPGAVKLYFKSESLPPMIHDLAAAERYAAAVAWSAHRPLWLVWSRRLSVWFDAAGVVTSRRLAVPGEWTRTIRPAGGPGLILDDPQTGQASLSIAGWSVPSGGNTASVRATRPAG